MPPKEHAHALDPKPVLDLIASIEADLQRLKGLVEQQVEKFDPANPHNKSPDGKLTEEGVECCYRMFDNGKSRYSVAQQMKISFAAATHRFNAWRKLGGSKRQRTLLG
ncbi:MAG: hypothetical protein EOS58_20210 [Mesorhizobium sp.]|uniref:hypothetical protein n=1 Tax=unclassified Mesorhizobium TaxID=325217 RepID=UPI000FCABDEE|nr:MULTISPECIES: hypothetical protein [unclassified Mesorhizobium]RVD74072.1 hypothetical protein EN751_01305 [Mesorhizobium sp. M4A.F.Ca.ET.029.04.2.1]RUX52178.1 hypothetical protein EOA33_03745 [Mesorhizobium sp. M4A.F.Ca.ET.050.02.1.1]RVC76408.1 hypothetical protein EN745_24820 [Mesorhizobium sp. M4A.F.Ca.ET.022.05.2.1]RVD34205.1 hypothetical protein EN742_27925 [Mesorhizobium sp. M4A.F.Ca.ET.020.02.1.1]RWC18528.1 MAG: hypothetical protein EOS53_16370 [Mesorhizobium sp.]